MSKSNVEMSLDDIIKANKRKEKETGKATGKGKKTGGILKRGKRIVKQPVKTRLQKAKFTNAGTFGAKRAMNNKVNKPSTVATKKLVQKLVKKALAQTNVRNIVKTRMRPVIQRPKFRSGRIMKRSVMANPLKMNPRSRVIARRPRVNAQQLVAVRGRGQMRYNPQNINVGSVVRRVNYVPMVKPVVVQTMPRAVYVQQRMPRQVPAYQPVQSRASIRAHISQLRNGSGGGGRQAQQKVVYVTRPQSRRPIFQQQQQVVFQPQRRVQQQQQTRRQPRRNNNNFSRPQQYKNDPFFEPPNFLQRVPVEPQQSRGGRRY